MQLLVIDKAENIYGLQSQFAGMGSEDHKLIVTGCCHPQAMNYGNIPSSVGNFTSQTKTRQSAERLSGNETVTGFWSIKSYKRISPEIFTAPE